MKMPPSSSISYYLLAPIPFRAIHHLPTLQTAQNSLQRVLDAYPGAIEIETNQIIINWPGSKRTLKNVLAAYATTVGIYMPSTVVVDATDLKTGETEQMTLVLLSEVLNKLQAIQKLGYALKFLEREQAVIVAEPVIIEHTKTAAKTMYEELEEFFTYLYARWQDEKHEDFEDYTAVVETKLKPYKAKLLQMYKSPFGPRFSLNGRIYKITVTSKDYSYNVVRGKSHS